MRGIIIKSVTIDEVLAIRHLQAAEGYLDLGMFREAEEELGLLDPAWVAPEHILFLKSRVDAGLQVSK